MIWRSQSPAEEEVNNRERKLLIGNKPAAVRFKLVKDEGYLPTQSFQIRIIIGDWQRLSVAVQDCRSILFECPKEPFVSVGCWQREQSSLSPALQ